MDMLKQLTGSQKGGRNEQRGSGGEPEESLPESELPQGVRVDPPSLSGEVSSFDGDGDNVQMDQGRMGGRRRKSHKGNSWLAHVKATMKLNRGKSFKQILKMAKKSYKKSQSQSSSQSQSGGKRRKSKGGKGKGTRKGQYGGSGGKVAGVGASASPYV